MKKFTIFFCTLFLSLLISPSLFAAEMRVGYKHLSHLIEKQDGSDKPVGRLVTYWESMASRMGVTITWVGPLPSTRIISYLKNKQIDAIYLASKNSYRETIGLCAEKPILTMQPVICFHKEKTITNITTWDNLQTLKKIGTIHGHRLSLSLAQNYPNLPLAQIMDTDPVRFSLTKLASGELDAFIYPGRTGLLEAIKELDLEDLIVVSNAPVPPTGYYAFFATTRKDLVEKYNMHHGEVPF